VPLYLTPASAKSATAVTITNTTGQSLPFKLTFTSCAGKDIGQSSGTLANGDSLKTRGGHGHRVITFTVARPGGQIAASASLQANQGCPPAGVAKARVGALAPPVAHTGAVAVAVPVAHANYLDPLLAVALALGSLAAGIAGRKALKARRAARAQRDQHARATAVRGSHRVR
jgi:hypothetical protein